jgi:hypothetical protein
MANTKISRIDYAGVSIIEVENVVDFIRTHQAQINQILKEENEALAGI